MADPSSFDTERAHKFFSAYCFNSAWEFIDKPKRTSSENEQMIQYTLASLWHWSQRPDSTEKNLSIGYWQAARVYALAGEADNARKYAQLCLDITPTDDTFYLGYAHEAMARAQFLSRRKEEAQSHLSEAREQAKMVASAENKKLLEDDLDSLG